MNKFSLAVVFLILPAILLAQKKPENTKADTTRLEEVTVVSSRFSEKKNLVAQHVQLVSEDRLRRLNAPSTAEVLMQTPGVFVQKSQLGGGSPVIRGFEANRVLLVVDGVRLNNAIYRAGHLQNAITLDNNSLERMEIAFGPSSVSYGSDALGGVIHFYTKRPEINKTAVSAFSRYASAAEEKTGGFSFNLGKHTWASFTNLTFSDFGDLRQGANNAQPGTASWKRPFYVVRQGDQDKIVNNRDHNIQKQSGYQQIDLLQKFLFKNNDQLSQLINLQYSTSSNIPRYDRLAQIQNSNPAYGEWYYGPQQRLLASYQLSLSGHTGWFNRSNITVAFQNVEESRHDRRFNSLNLNNRRENVDIFSLNADFNKAWIKHDLSYGLEVSHNHVKSSAYQLNINTLERTRLDTRYPDGGSQVFSAAAFLSHRYEISPRFSISEGIRLSHSNLHSTFNDQTFFPFPFNSVQQNNNALSGNVSLIYKPSAGWKISGLGSTSFRAPNIDDLSKVFESVPGKIIVPNPDLKPEYTYNTELGIAKTFNKRANFNISGFYTWYRNAITTQPFLFNGQATLNYKGQLSDVTANVNAGRAYLYGLSADLSTQLFASLRVKTSATYTYARITSSSPRQPLDHIPPFFANGSLAYQQDRLETEFFVQYNGPKELEDYNPNGEDNLVQATATGMPSWYSLNLRGGYHLNSSIKIQIGLENILDRNYRVFASGISAPGRNLILSVRGNF